jgi:hypothetical protein
LVVAADRLLSGTRREMVVVDDRPDGAVKPMVDKRQPDDRQEK